MAAERYRLTFADGESREVVRRPIHQVRAEVVAGSPGTMTYAYATFWAADTGGKGDRRAFEAWCEDFEDFEALADAEDDAAPLAAGADTSHG